MKSRDPKVLLRAVKMVDNLIGIDKFYNTNISTTIGEISFQGHLTNELLIKLKDKYKIEFTLNDMNWLESNQKKSIKFCLTIK